MLYTITHVHTYRITLNYRPIGQLIYTVPLIDPYVLCLIWLALAFILPMTCSVLGWP